jgi:hypothetical protein
MQKYNLFRSEKNEEEIRRNAFKKNDVHMFGHHIQRFPIRDESRFSHTSSMEIHAVRAATLAAVAAPKFQPGDEALDLEGL